VNVLLIKTKNIGDALLLTAAARAIRRDHPRAEITALVRRGTEGILRGAISIDQVATLGRAPGPAETPPPPAAPWWTRHYDVAMASKQPAFIQRCPCGSTASHGGRSLGRARQRHPLRTMDRRALKTCLRSWVLWGA
jgi:polysaccharide pyruvyl transferase WcaK-like protein